MTLIPINYADFEVGGLDELGAYLSDRNINLGAKTSPFIPVTTNATYTINISYDLNKLANVQTKWAWGRLWTYDSNFKPVAQIGVYNKAADVYFGEYEVVTKIPSNVKYIRLSASHISQDAAIITINSEQPENPPVKTILRLHANGDFETIGTPLNEGQSYSFGESGITVPKIIEYPPYRNYFIEKTSVSGVLSPNDGITMLLADEYDRTSDFINVTGWTSGTIRLEYSNLAGSFRPWVAILLYDENKRAVDILFDDYIAPANTKGDWVFTSTFELDVSYIRICVNYYDHPTTDVKVSLTMGDTIHDKHYLAYEDMPSWVKDTGQPISIFPEGIVIKGEIIHTEEESVLFKDDFNRPDANTLGDKWTLGRGSFAIENNMAKATGGGNVSSTAFCTFRHSNNVSISADIKRHSSESLIFRASDAYNTVFVQFEGSDLKLKQTINSVTTTLRTVWLNTSTTVFYRVSVELRGEEIKVFVDDVLRITHVLNANLDNTLCGFHSWSSSATNGRFDNFEIRALPVEPNSVPFKDDFDRPDANSLGGGWTVVSGNYSIKDGFAKPTGTYSMTNTAIVDVGESDNLRISATITPFKTEGLVIRYVDSANFIYVVDERGWINLRSVINGIETNHKFTQISELYPESFNLTVDLRGQEITVFINDTFLLSASSENFLFNSTKFGLSAWSDSGILGSIGHFDDFEIKRLLP